MQQPPMMLVPMPMMYYWPPPPPSLPKEAPPEVTTVPQTASPEEVSDDRSNGTVNHVEDEVYYQLVDCYEHPSLWRFVEEGLWIRSTTLSTLESCCVENATGDHCL